MCITEYTFYSDMVGLYCFYVSKTLVMNL